MYFHRPMPKMIWKALLPVMLILPSLASAQQAKNFNRALNTASSYEELNKAIKELPKSEKSSEILLKRLKRNLSKMKGNVGAPWSQTTNDGHMWGSYPSENALLVGALAQQGYTKAVPILQKMLKTEPYQTGISAANLAHDLYQLTGQPVQYNNYGKIKTYPE